MKPGSIVNKKDIKTLVSTNAVFKKIYEEHGPPPNWQREPGFVSLSKIILEQQVSLASADAHFKKLHAYIKKFTPENILCLSGAEMRNAQISRQKATYLRALAEAIIKKEINLDELTELDETEARVRLTKIKGIGQWTTDIYFLFCLQARDIFPPGDIAVVNTVKELFQIQSKEEILSLSGQWKPVRSLATYFLWHYYLSKRQRKALI